VIVPRRAKSENVHLPVNIPGQVVAVKGFPDRFSSPRH
jgi:hypothetical protein